MYVISFTIADVMNVSCTTVRVRGSAQSQSQLISNTIQYAVQDSDKQCPAMSSECIYVSKQFDCSVSQLTVVSLLALVQRLQICHGFPVIFFILTSNFSSTTNDDLNLNLNPKFKSILVTEHYLSVMMTREQYYDTLISIMIVFFFTKKKYIDRTKARAEEMRFESGI
jgi:hypothetical protein